MDDEVVGGWRIDPETRAAMRVDRVRKALDAGDWHGAVIEVEELLDEEPKHPEGLFLLAEALLELGDPEGAVDAYAAHLAVAGPSPGALAGLGIAKFEICDLLGAVEATREAVRIAPDLGEAHYYLGLSLERIAGRKSEAVTAFVAANRLDPEAYPFPLQVGRRQWDELVARALRQIPDNLQGFWKDVPIKLEELPILDELRATDPPLSPTVSGLYEGVPPEEGDPWEIKPTAMRLFTGNLARLGRVDAVSEEMARVLTSEALDWLGLEEEDLPSP